jgi:hypothetical protein
MEDNIQLPNLRHSYKFENLKDYSYHPYNEVRIEFNTYFSISLQPVRLQLSLAQARSGPQTLNRWYRRTRSGRRSEHFTSG